jgi:hypothetical protein
MNHMKTCSRHYRLSMQYPDVKMTLHKSSLLLTNGSVCSHLFDERIIRNALVIPFCTLLAPRLSYMISRYTILHHTCGTLDTHRAS